MSQAPRRLRRNKMKYRLLNNGVQMPVLGYGVYQVDPAGCERCVSDAIDVGYRSIDTAQAYANERGVGNAVKKSGIARSEFFITTKVWITNAGEQAAAKSIESSLKELQTDYIDLLLIHQPFGDYYGTYRAMEKAVRDGKVRAIGVSNFAPDRLIDLYNFCEIKPAVNQVETHLFHQQRAAHEVMEKYGVAHESWGPFAEGRKDFFTNKTLAEVAAKYGKTPAQTALRFLLQSGVIVIPKSTHKNRMAGNFDVFGFSLKNEDMQTLKGLDEDESAFFSHQDPATVEWFMSMVNAQMGR